MFKNKTLCFKNNKLRCNNLKKVFAMQTLFLNYKTIVKSKICKNTQL